MKRYILFFIMSVVFLVSNAGNIRLKVESERGNTIGVGDLFYITYELTNVDGAPSRPSDVPGGKLAYFTLSSQRSSYSNINGHSEHSVVATYTATIRATKEGKFSFGPVSVGGVRSNVVSYTIGKASSSDNSSVSDAQNSSKDDKPKFIGKGDGNLFLRASISKTAAYEQEALVYTLKLYTTYNAVKFIGATSAPKFEGFVIEESDQTSSQFSYETYQGKQYATAVIARYIIFPQMTGALKVLGNTYTISVDRNEYYHDPFWGRMSISQPLQLNVTPNDLLVNVKPLPTPKPADFSGGVGQFSISAILGGNNFRTNQAASVVYTVNGSGNLKYIKLPELGSLYPSQLDVMSPTTKLDTKVGSDNVSGSIRFDYSFVPLEEGAFKIPAVKLVFFNPASGKYETVLSRGFDITVGKGNASSKSQKRVKAVFDSQLMPMTVDLSIEHPLYVYTFLYWLFYVVPAILLISVMIYYRHYIKINSDIVAVRSRKAGKVAQRRLRQAYISMKKGDKSSFYSNLLIALVGYISDKLRMPTSELSRENMKEEMIAHGIDEHLTDRIISLIDDCEFAKYSSANSDNDLKEMYDKSANVINEIELAVKKSEKIKLEYKEDEI